MATFQGITSDTLTGTAIAAKAPAYVAKSTYGPLISPTIDGTWGGYLFAQDQNNPYFQQFFSGQDIIVSIDGSTAPYNYLPVLNLGYNVQQTKLMLYGFWDYTYSAVARGARQIAGRFSLATTNPAYMTQVLANVAANRMHNAGSGGAIATMSADEQNIMTYWGGGANVQPQEIGTTLDLWQAHPTFNMSITYGTQDVSVNQSLVNNPPPNEPVWLDTNERLVITPGTSETVTLEACELLSMSTQYSPDGTPVAETYDFVANDVYSHT